MKSTVPFRVNLLGNLWRRVVDLDQMIVRVEQIGLKIGCRPVQSEDQPFGIAICGIITIALGVEMFQGGFEVRDPHCKMDVSRIYLRLGAEMAMGIDREMDFQTS